LALGGRQSIKTPNNQTRVGGSGRGYLIAEAGGGGSEVGDTVQSFGAANGTTKKYIIINISWLLAALDQT
jgi:hypothetical protein